MGALILVIANVTYPILSDNNFGETKPSSFCWYSIYVNRVVVSNIFYFRPYLGRLSNLTNIFQMGWNHQPVKI